MPSLLTSDLAAVSAGSHLYLYYQNGHELRETQSTDGKAWTANSTAIAADLDENGSAITAYFVKYDGGYGGKSTARFVHVIWINKNLKLSEKVRIEGETTWKSIAFPTEFKPTATSRLGSGVCHDNHDDQSHQWVHFVEESDGKFRIAELRRGAKASPEFVYRKPLREDPADALPGTAIAEYLSDVTTHLFFQDHAMDLLEYDGGYEKWNDKHTRLEGKKVSHSTPLAACDSGKSDEPYVFYVSPPSGNTGLAIQQWQVNQEPKRVDDYAPGSRLGATGQSGKVYLFFKKATTSQTITVKEYSGGNWSPATKVV